MHRFSFGQLLICASLLVAGQVPAQELPPAPKYLGEIQRLENGRLGVVSGEQDVAQTARPGHADAAEGRQAVDRKPASASASASAKPQATVRSVQVAFHCASEAITCVEVASQSERVQAVVPLTFGQPFARGDLSGIRQLVARDIHGETLPLQGDAVSSHADGSVRFAVLSTVLRDLKPGERRVINLLASGTTVSAVQAVDKPSSDVGLRLVMTVRSPQITQLTFGNREETNGGTPFLAGETIRLQLGSGSAQESFSLTVSQDMAGGQFQTLTKIAIAMMQIVNLQSHRYKAFKIGEGGGYERVWLTTREPDVAAFLVKADYAGKARIAQVNLQSARPNRRYEARLADGVASPVSPFLRGNVVTEQNRVLKFVDPVTHETHPTLSARVDLRRYAETDAMRADITLENTWLSDPDPGNVTYDLDVLQNQQVLAHDESIPHYAHGRWHRVLWMGAAPAVALRHDMAYFVRSKAVWNYDLAVRIPDSVLAEEAGRLAKSDTSPMGAALITPYFPTTGGRGELGPLPRWAVLYLLSQDARARAVLFANADAAGSVPIHYRDPKTSLPAGLDAHPDFWTNPVNVKPKEEKTPAYRLTPWKPDVSHQASFAYLPYLLTGDLYYLEEMLFWANWNMLSINPGYRGSAKGLIWPEQIRGQAWALRALGEVDRILPDKHLMKSQMQRHLKDNLAWYVDRYRQRDVSPLGCIVQGDNPTKTAPWQNDFMGLVIGQLAESGNPVAADYFSWMGKCVVERWTSEGQGFCRSRAAAYWPTIADDKHRFYASWGEVFRQNWPEDRSCSSNRTLDGAPESSAGYLAYARAALAQAATLRFSGALDAYTWLYGQTPEITRRLGEDPTWAIVPRPVVLSR